MAQGIHALGLFLLYAVGTANFMLARSLRRSRLFDWWILVLRDELRSRGMSVLSVCGGLFGSCSPKQSQASSMPLAGTETGHYISGYLRPRQDAD